MGGGSTALRQYTENRGGNRCWGIIVFMRAKSSITEWTREVYLHMEIKSGQVQIAFGSCTLSLVHTSHISPFWKTFFCCWAYNCL